MRVTAEGLGWTSLWAAWLTFPLVGVLPTERAAVLWALGVLPLAMIMGVAGIALALGKRQPRKGQGVAIALSAGGTISAAFAMVLIWGLAQW